MYKVLKHTTANTIRHCIGDKKENNNSKELAEKKLFLIIYDGTYPILNL